MKVVSSRFGTMDLDDGDAIAFRHGLIGFPEERSFVLLRPGADSLVGWLQSTVTEWLALPVVAIEALDIDYSAVPVGAAAEAAAIGSAESPLATMIVLCAPGGGATPTVNLLAPIIVNAETRLGAQILLDDARFSTREPFAVRRDAGGARPDGAAVGMEDKAPVRGEVVASATP